MSSATDDPVVQTVLEALQGAPPRATLIWGQGLSPVAHAPSVTDVHTLLQDARETGPGVGHTSYGIEAPDAPFERVVTRLPRSKEALRWRVAAAAAALGPGGELWLAGHQREGIKSAIKQLGEAVGDVVTVRIKRRCRVLVAHRRENVPPPRSLEDVAQRVAFEGAAGALTAVTLPGGFSHGRLDEGTRRMLAFLAAHPPAGRVLDLGAGAGILGVACATYPDVESVTLVETAWVGAEGCRRTVASNAVKALVDVQHADVLATRGGPFDLVVTNPPFHDGREEDRRLISRFAKAAAARLKPGGRLLAVCNTHLPYRDALSEHFTDVSVVAEDTRFRIWSCTGPRR